MKHFVDDDKRDFLDYMIANGKVDPELFNGKLDALRFLFLLAELKTQWT